MDWESIILELAEQHGMSQPAIATACGCSQPSISALARGETKDPRHSIGQALCELLATKRREAEQKRAAAAPASGAAQGAAAAGG